MIETQKISFEYIKKRDYLASHEGMRFMLKKHVEKSTDEEGNEKSESFLKAIVWPEPLSYSKTDKSLMVEKNFPFTRDGKEEAVVWLNEMLPNYHK